MTRVRRTADQFKTFEDDDAQQKNINVVVISLHRKRGDWDKT